MSWIRNKGIIVNLFAVFLMLAFASTAMAKSVKVGVFQKVLEADDDFPEVTAALEQSIAKSNLELLGKMDIAVPENAQKARTYILTSPVFNQAALGNMPADAISVLILRIGVYEAYGKVNINIANPDALANVYFDGVKNNDALMAAASAAKNELVQVIRAVPGKAVSTQQEPIRKLSKYRGYDGDGPAKMMAKFRDFRESLLTVKEVDGSTSLDTIIGDLKSKAAASRQADTDKGFHVVAVKKFDGKAAWLGITNRYTETKCININSDFRFSAKADNNKYPGVDHAPALPLELVIYKGKDGKWQIAQYGEMWRMQLYFWDSGYLAFAKNTLIPSTIFGDIEDMVKGK
ncbi:MAG: hypothetical protein GXP58_10890 [Deltaproteobacteria bacterium]|nr:hypothetical protein [Deltaproteobacteria bacterium]